MKLTILRWFLWVLVMVMVALGIASVRLEDQAYLVLLETETAPHPEPWPQPRVTLFVFTHDVPCASRQNIREAARTLRLYGWTVIAPDSERDQEGEVRTTTKSSTNGGRS